MLQCLLVIASELLRPFYVEAIKEQVLAHCPGSGSKDLSRCLSCSPHQLTMKSCGHLGDGVIEQCYIGVLACGFETLRQPSCMQPGRIMSLQAAKVSLPIT